MMLTPASVLILLLIAGALGLMGEGYRVAMLAAIASAAAVILRPRA